MQLPEKVENTTIAELTKERLRRAAKLIAKENPDYKGDMGFRVYKLDSSNLRAWDSETKDVEASLLENLDNIKPDRSEDDLLTELLLKLGLGLTAPIEEKTVAGCRVHAIGGGALMVCLSEKIKSKDVEALALAIADWHKALAPASETTVIFRDSGFADDVAKANMTAILKQNKLPKVRSL